MSDGHIRLWKVHVRRWDEFLTHYIEADTKEQAEEQAAELYEPFHDLDYVDGGFDLIEAEPEEE